MFHLTCQIYWMNSYLNYSTAHSPKQFLAEKFANIRKTLILNILKIALTLYYVYNVTNSLIRSANFWPPNLLSAHICDCNIKLIFTHLVNLTVPWQNITPAVSNIGLLNCGNPTHWSLFYTIKMTEEQGIIFWLLLYFAPETNTFHFKWPSGHYRKPSSRTVWTSFFDLWVWMYKKL